ncbi:hypothetical protein CR513_44019, partial [Mucuna pruriens]
MRTSSLNNKTYFILFIDDFSRMTWVYFLKEKSKVFGIFKKFKSLVKKQSGKHIKVLRSNRGKEYNSHEFDKFCKDKGIKRQLTIAYSPQQNGFTLLSTYSTDVQLGNTRQDFHCSLECYMHVPNQKIHKLENKTIYGIFLGYIYNLQTKKLTINQDVEVDENAAWNWQEKVMKNNIPILMQKLQEAEEIARDLDLRWISMKLATWPCLSLNAMKKHQIKKSESM